MYVIDKIVVEYHPAQDQNYYMIWYRDDTGTYLGLNIAISVDKLYKADSPELLIIEKVYNYDPQLGSAVAKWIGKDYGIFENVGTISAGPYKITSDGLVHTKHVHAKYDQGGLLNAGAINTVATFEPGGVDELPGLREYVNHPIVDDTACFPGHKNTTLRSMIMHLNDYHMWTREQIADWLESLDVDLRFKSPDDRLREQKAKELEKLKNSVENLTISIVEWNAKIKEANIQIKLFKDKMNQLQEEENVQD